MDNLLYIGQWQGFFKYGPEYGTIIEGKQAEFRFFIEEYKNGEFSGRIIDWDGLGADGEVAVATGFINGEIISFIKQYSQGFVIDEWGNSSLEEDLPGHKVIYEGRFNKDTNQFVGDWEIVRDLAHTPELTIEEVLTGTWRMQIHDYCT